MAQVYTSLNFVNSLLNRGIKNLLHCAMMAKSWRDNRLVEKWKLYDEAFAGRIGNERYYQTFLPSVDGFMARSAHGSPSCWENQLK